MKVSKTKNQFKTGSQKIGINIPTKNCQKHIFNGNSYEWIAEPASGNLAP